MESSRVKRIHHRVPTHTGRGRDGVDGMRDESEEVLVTLGKVP